MASQTDIEKDKEIEVLSENLWIANKSAVDLEKQLSEVRQELAELKLIAQVVENTWEKHANALRSLAIWMVKLERAAEKKPDPEET